jgi:hypothetical protein
MPCDMTGGGGTTAPGCLCRALWLMEEGRFQGRRRGGAMRGGGGGVPDRAGRRGEKGAKKGMRGTSYDGSGERGWRRDGRR